MFYHKIVVNTAFLRFCLLGLSIMLILSVKLQAQNNLAQTTGQATASSVRGENLPSHAIDGKPDSFWASGEEDGQAWLMVRLPGATELTRVSISFGQDFTPNTHLELQYLLNGTWRSIHKIGSNTSNKIEVDFEKPLLTDRIRLAAADGRPMQLVDFGLFGQAYVDSSAMDVKPVLVNQSGYNLHRPKRFTAPGIKEGTAFHIVRNGDSEIVYQGLIKGEKGDFSDFNPESTDEFVVVIGEKTSFPFRIAPNWLERVTYRLMLDFMLGARHYVGNVTEIRPLSFEWRDGDFFNWSLQSLVAMYLSNPAAFERMEVHGKYLSNESYPNEYAGFWGELEPFAPRTPDMVQLIHWDVDVKVSMKLDHEMQKAELAHFLYAWPYLQRWLPRQNFDVVYGYAKSVWSKRGVSAHATSQYDLSVEHDLLSLKRQLGTTKGEMPPGYSVIPNLMMYEVAVRQQEPDAEKYFKAAYDQLSWMIENLDWNDPMTTKGQRMSEHITMRAFAYFFTQYPDKHPKGLKKKVEEWASVALSRSDNMWDFRKYAEDEWTPPGWNETGNILGFPAAALAAMMVLEDGDTKDNLEVLVWSHLENAFGRNPTGRQFSYKGPEEVEGVDLGWYSRHKGGIGLLEELPFVFDGSPKSFHYPNNPEVGDLGWTEGWVQFNTAFNTSMAYLAAYYSSIHIEKQGDNVQVTLQAPLNFHPDEDEPVSVNLVNKNSGEQLKIDLIERHGYSLSYSSLVPIEKGKLTFDGQSLELHRGDELEVSYGYGYFKSSDRFVW